MSKKPVTTSTNPSSATTPAAAYEPPIYSPEAGKRALHTLLPILAAIPDTDFATLRVDVESATYAALGVAGFVADPSIHARFARLPASELDIADVDGLAPVCFATFFALSEARSAGALETEAKVPLDLVTEATQLEARMQALCEYHFTDDPEIKPEIDRLRPGSGHRDLANDLLGYARIYELRHDVVASDPKHYRPGDAARAKQLAGSIIQALSAAMTPKAREAFDRYARAWTLLCRRYDEVRAAGLWLFRRDPQREQRFPSLFAAGRTPYTRPRKQPSESENGAPGTPVTPVTP